MCPFYENNNQKDILKGLFDAVYYCKHKSKIVDVGLLTGIQGGLVTQMLLNFGGEKFCEIANKVANGELVGGFAITEEGMSGSEVYKMKTTYCYNEKNKTYRIKTDPDHPKWFQGASMGDFLIVLAKKEEAREFALFYVPQDKISSTRKWK